MAEPGGLTAALARRPLLLVLAGSHGAGKTTFFHAHLAPSGLRFINADVLTRELGIDSGAGAAAADALRGELIRQRESFVTETVFADPVGAKLGQFTAAMAAGYTVVLLFIAVSGPQRSDERIAMRVSQGGHDVPADRLAALHPRTLANLRAAIPLLSQVLIYDHDDLRRPYRLVAGFAAGRLAMTAGEVPDWLRGIIPQ